MRTAKIMLMSSIACIGTFAAPALAQNADEVGAGTEEIIVTARRQNEKLLDVPASVTVFTAKTLEQTGIRTANDFVKLTPGVSIVTGTAEAGDTQINIRGLNGARDAENNVALVVDGILKTNTSALNQNQGALQQIEVLKGPQNAIYGRNASAGAIVISTRKPGDHLQAEGRASYGNNKTFAASAFVSGPISDIAGFVLSGDYGSSDGFFRNTFLPTATNTATYPGNSTRAASVDDYKRFDINGRLLINPSDSTEIDIKARYGEVKSAAIAFNAGFQIPGLFAINQSVDSNIDVNKHIFRFDSNIDPNNDQRTIELSGRFTTDVNFAKLTGYLAYSNIKNDFYADGTSGAFGFFGANPTCAATAAATAGVIVQEPFQTVGPFRGSQPYGPSTCDGTQYQRRNQKEVSAELRLVSNTNGPVTWQLGGYFLNINRRVCVNLGLDTGRGVVEQCYTTDPRNPTEGLADDTFRTNVYAAFGSLDYAVSDKFKAGFALRYDIEERKVGNNVPTSARTRWVGNPLTGYPNGTATTPANYFLNPGLDPAYNPSGVLPARQATFRQLEPKVTLTYKPNSATTIYANWGIGFKSGGFNASGSKAIIDGFFNNGTALFIPGVPINAGLSINDQYKKETSSAFEAGIKGSFADGRISYELAGYYTTVRNQQFFEFFVGPFGLLRVVSNIDKVEIYGAEASVNARIVKGWNVFASGNVIDSKIKKNSARPYTVGNKSPYTADYTINIGSQIEFPVSDTIDFSMRSDYRITGPTFFHTVQNNNVPNLFFGGAVPGNFTNSQRDAFGILNLRAALTGKNWSIAAFGNNVMATKYLAEVIPAPEFGGDFISPGARSYYGIEVGFKF